MITSENLLKYALKRRRKPRRFEGALFFSGLKATKNTDDQTTEEEREHPRNDGLSAMFQRIPVITVAVLTIILLGRWVFWSVDDRLWSIEEEILRFC